ncbi:hybrid sensor histidine kinase/response regulator [Gellertiella hungarica]|uniref:histidine kinase n=1 Tax=Gellertiella hungarica TaxID=1572859 RepID=A0A7W6J6W4_9HYPH|nr:PAS domain-containing sensor histidine kinase [Gellertiella hungarica]MBB4065884.1 PAS domain S-box-containing protein [Gellertiella hungarica]
MQGDRDLLDSRMALVEGRYRLLVDAIKEYAIYMLDTTGRVISWNSGAERFKGYRAPEILGSHFSRFYTPEDRHVGLPARALQIAEREGRFENEGWRVRKDGTRFWAHVVLDPIRGPDGHLIAFAKITRDLTDKKRIEAELRLSETQFRVLVDGVIDYAIFMLGLNGDITTWNPGAERIKGYSREEVVGTSFSRFYTPEDIEAGIPRQALAVAYKTGRFETEGWRVRKNGTRFWASVVIDAIRDEMGSVVGFAKVTRDITEKREAQRALDQAREELFQAQKMEALGRLTGGIAHDFNNLLMAITGSLELLRRHLPDDEKTAQLIANALEGANRGAALTRQMLAFSRKQDLNLEPVDLNQLAREVKVMLERTIGPGISIEARIPSSLPRVRSDVNQLTSALLNLAVNARDAMPHGGRMRFGAKATEISDAPEGGPPLRPGSYVCLFVSDEGIGMDQETLEKSTTPFFTTKEIGKGTGLGLSMVHGFMEQSGGRLLLHSKPGRGTRAELWLPALAEEQPVVRKPEKGDTRLPGRQRHLKVLAVDDDPLVLLNTVLMLEGFGHHVEQTTSAPKALDMLASDPSFDLLVSDQSMPKMTGLELIEEVRRHRPGLPCVLATGYSQEAGLKLEGVTWLAKPFTEHDLNRAVAEATGK